MARSQKYVKAFQEKLSALEKSSGLKYEILYEDLDSNLMENRLSPCWFSPGDVLASAKSDDHTVVFEVTGGLRADLCDPDGEIAYSFDDCINALEDNGDGFCLLDDNDLNALVSRNHPSGYILKIHKGNTVSAYVQDSSIQAEEANRLSVAKAILDQSVAVGLMDKAAKADAERIELPPEEFFPANEKTEKEETSARSKALAKSAEMLDEMAEPGVSAKEVKNVAPAEPKKVEKKEAKAKKAETPEKKEIKKTKPASEKSEPTVAADKAEPSVSERFDLLPLDFVSDFISAFDNAKESDFFKDIEAFKGGNGSLLDAAVSFAKAHYPEGAVDAVMVLAAAFSEDAAANGEDAWKSRDARSYISDAVKSYLLFLKEGCDKHDHILDVLFALFCGSWVSAGKQEVA